MTPLDALHAAMVARPDDETARLSYMARLIGTELFLLLEREPDGDVADPRLFETLDGRFVLAFDLEERLAAFAGGPAPYAALSGRALASRLAGQSIGLGVNLGTANEELLPSEALDWLAERAGAAPSLATSRPQEIHPPSAIPEMLLSTLDARLAAAEGLASSAWLVGVTWETGARGDLLVFIDARPEVEAGLAQSVAEALAFSGLEAGAIDVAFRAATDPLAARLAKVGLRFDIPEPRDTTLGRDPAEPPRLR